MQVQGAVHDHRSHEDASVATDAADILLESFVLIAAEGTAKGNATGPATALFITTATPYNTSSTAGQALVVVHASCFPIPHTWFFSSRYVSARLLLPQKEQLEFNFLWGKDLTLSNHL